MTLEHNWGEELEFIRGLLRPEWNVVQAGASTGVFPIEFACHTKHVLCAEPQRPTFEALLKNIALSGLSNVHAINVGFGATSGEVYCPDVECGRTDIALRCDPKVGYLVSLMRIDDIAVSPIDFIQLDVEGMEVEALEGARKIIAQSRPILYLENNYPESISHFCAFNGYRVAESAPNNNVVLRPCPA